MKEQKTKELKMYKIGFWIISVGFLLCLIFILYFGLKYAELSTEYKTLSNNYKGCVDNYVNLQSSCKKLSDSCSQLSNECNQVTTAYQQCMSQIGQVSQTSGIMDLIKLISGFI